MKNLISKILDIFNEDLLPKTNKGVLAGNKIFGAFILNKIDLSPVIIESNNEIKNPLFHGEINTLMKFYEIPETKRPLTKNCLFISSHEPCSLCLSAITWCGFDNFYYLFSYSDTAKKYNIPHDLRILKEVFYIKKGRYNKNNSYWNSYSLLDLINNLPEAEKNEILTKFNKISKSYGNLSIKYQTNKNINKIPLK